MARTIGTKYRNQVKKLVRNNIDKEDVHAVVREQLPMEAFETWEGAYDEIDSIINDTIMED